MLVHRSIMWCCELATKGVVLQGVGPTFAKDKINMKTCCPWLQTIFSGHRAIGIPHLWLLDFGPQLRGHIERPNKHAHFWKLDTHGSPGGGGAGGSLAWLSPLFFYQESLANLKLCRKKKCSHISVRKTSGNSREPQIFYHPAFPQVSQ